MQECMKLHIGRARYDKITLAILSQILSDKPHDIIEPVMALADVVDAAVDFGLVIHPLSPSTEGGGGRGIQ